MQIRGKQDGTRKVNKTHTHNSQPATTAAQQTTPPNQHRGQQPSWVSNGPTAAGVGALPNGV